MADRWRLRMRPWSCCHRYSFVTSCDPKKRQIRQCSYKIKVSGTREQIPELREGKEVFWWSGTGLCIGLSTGVPNVAPPSLSLSSSCRPSVEEDRLAPDS